MRKYVLMIIMLLTWQSSFGQTQHAFKLGLNYSDIAGQVDYDKWKLGYNIGFVEGFAISRNFEIQAEISYSTKGAISTLIWTNEFGNEMGTFDIVYSYGYIEFPVLAKYNFVAGDKNGLGLLFGPHISFLTIAHWRIAEPEKLEIVDEKHDIRENTNAMDYGVISGLDYEFSLSRIDMFVDVRYSLGLNSLSKFSDWSWSHHQLISSSIGIRF